MARIEVGQGPRGPEKPPGAEPANDGLQVCAELVRLNVDAAGDVLGWLAAQQHLLYDQAVGLVEELGTKGQRAVVAGQGPFAQQTWIRQKTHVQRSLTFKPDGSTERPRIRPGVGRRGWSWSSAPGRHLTAHKRHASGPPGPPMTKQ
ncbi:MAG: hypothetical protein ACOC93_06415 [Planctomycetota bacterium]